MNNVSAKAKKLARELLRENRRGRSWRVIAKQDFDNTINYATLNRFAVSKGAWIPKDERILIILGLKKVRPPIQHEPIPEWVKPIRKRIASMAKQTRISLGLQK